MIRIIAASGSYGEVAHVKGSSGSLYSERCRSKTGVERSTSHTEDTNQLYIPGEVAHAYRDKTGSSPIEEESNPLLTQEKQRWDLGRKIRDEPKGKDQPIIFKAAFRHLKRIKTGASLIDKSKPVPDE